MGSDYEKTVALKEAIKMTRMDDDDDDDIDDGDDESMNYVDIIYITTKHNIISP